MQSTNDKNAKYIAQLGELASKIARLRKRLVSFGYSSDEVVAIIMEEFLKLEKIDWTKLKFTTLFHQIKASYRVDTATAQMIMCLHNSIPNLHAPEVCEYLLSVLEYNSLAFGINLLDSSSDSNDSGSALHRRIINHSRRRMRPMTAKDRQRKLCHTSRIEKGKKKIHKDEKPEGDKLQDQKEDQLQKLFMNRPNSISLEFSEGLELEKELKKEIQSEDSEG